MAAACQQIGSIRSRATTEQHHTRVGEGRADRQGNNPEKCARFAKFQQ